MSIKPIYKVSSIIFLCVVFSALSVLFYVRHQNNTQQTVEVKYNPLTEAQKAIVKKNIKERLAQQKQERVSENQKNSDNQNPSVDEKGIDRTEYDSTEMNAEYVKKRPDFIDAHSNEIEAKKAKQKQQSSEKDASAKAKRPSDISFESLDSAKLPQGLSGLLGETVMKVDSMEELEEIIAKWENGDDPKLKVMVEDLKKQFNTDNVKVDDVKVEIIVVD